MSPSSEGGPDGARCPICGKPAGSQKFRPFCSRRCADVDLSRWLRGGYAIPGREDDAPPAEGNDSDEPEAEPPESS